VICWFLSHYPNGLTQDQEYFDFHFTGSKGFKPADAANDADDSSEDSSSSSGATGEESD